MRLSVVTLVASFALWSSGFCAEQAQGPAQSAAPGKAPRRSVSATVAKLPSGPPPTLANVPYGADPRQVLDLWKAESTGPAPLLFFIHGGGWQGGDKKTVYASGLTNFLSAGISVVSVEYRFVAQAHASGVKPPVEWPLHDAARALQFVRSKAAEWNIDKSRIAASGGSAGACSSLWLAFHDDMADPNSGDPVARESTRLTCAGVLGAQTSLDPRQMKEWTPNSKYGAHAFGIFRQVNGKDVADFAQFLAERERILPWIKEYSPYELVSADDPPVYLYYSAPPALGQDQKDPTHTANFGVKLQEKLRSVGVECVLAYPGAPDLGGDASTDPLMTKNHMYRFLIAKLKG
ncbi:MAG TPA: alpha/beta hydrolase [Verrucomicrobiae bacterium]|nr:alpha/beta hydrolase [Verrucomicrobiae bacterium]